MPTLYGITNCDSVKKAQKWLNTHDIEFNFHDFRKDGLSNDKLVTWLDKIKSKEIELQALINKRSTTWKLLPDALKDSLATQMSDVSTINDTEVIHTLQQHPTLIKRPLLEVKNALHIGFTDKHYAQVLLK